MPQSLGLKKKRLIHYPQLPVLLDVEGRPSCYDEGRSKSELKDGNSDGMLMNVTRNCQNSIAKR